MGKELTYRKTSDEGHLELPRAAKVMGEMRTKHSGRAESLNMWQLDLRVITATSYSQVAHHLPGHPSPANQISKKLNWRDSRHGATRLSRDRSEAQGWKQGNCGQLRAIPGQVLSQHFQDAYQQAHHQATFFLEKLNKLRERVSRSCLGDSINKRLIGDLMTFWLVVLHMVSSPSHQPVRASLLNMNSQGSVNIPGTSPT